MQRNNLADSIGLVLAGEKGGGTPRQAVEAPDSLKSIATARIIDILSEGEIEGFAHGNAATDFLQDVYYNETPIQNADGTKNFKSVQVEARFGTQTQDHIPGFPSVENEIGIGVALTAVTPWTRSFTNLALSAVRVRLQVNGLSKTDTTNGDIKGYTVNYAIDIAVDGGAFTQVLTSAFTGKASSTYERSHRLELPAATTSGWIIRVRRLTVDDVTVYIQDDTAVASVTEIIDGKFAYPLTALVGSQMDAGQFQAIPTRSFHVKGRRIKVPVNYDPVTAIYTGVWDGTFKIAYSNNPAWVFYDLATNPRYGLGHLVQELQIDKWSLYAIGQYCDQTVPNGFGGTERRMTCNLYLQKQGDAFKVLTDLASIFRGICYWAGGSIVAVADRPTDPVYVYNNSNVVGGQFKYESSARKARHTAVLVSWNDMTDFGRIKVDYYDNPSAMARYGFNQVEIHAMGCTSRGQAQRLAKWILYSEELLTNTCSWSVGIDGTYAVPGQIVRVADKWRAGRRNGGRVSAATTTVVTLDKWPSVNPTIGDSFTIILPTGVSQTRLIGAFNAGLRTVTVGTPFASAPLAQSVWAIDSNDVNTQLFRVLQVLEDEQNSGMYHMVGLQHNPTLFDAVDLGEPISVAPISAIAPNNQPRPATVTVTSVERAGAVSSGILVSASWTPALGASSYRVQWKKDDGEWTTPQEINGTTADYDTPVPGIYTAQVSAVNALGVVSPPTLSAPFTVVDQTKKPTSITNIEGAMYGSGNLLEGSTFETLGSSGWSLVVDSDGWTSSIQSINLAGSSWHPPNINSLGWLRNGAHTGEYSMWSPAVPATAGIRYCASMYTAAHRTTGRLELQFHNAAGTMLLADFDTNIGALNGGSSLVAFQRPRVFLTAPAGTASMRMVMRSYARIGATDSYVWMIRPMLEEVSSLAVNPSPWVPSAASMESKILGAFAAAAAAQDTADGAIVTYSQTAAPAHPPASLGDFWIDSDDANKMYRSNGTSWVLARDTGIPQAILDAAAAQLTANGKVKTWFAVNASPPTASAVGDLWYVTDQAILKRWNGSTWALIADNAAETLNDYVANGKFDQGTAYWQYQAGWRQATNPGYMFSGNAALCADGAISPGVDSRAVCDKQFSVEAGEVYIISAMVNQRSPNGTFSPSLMCYNSAGTAVVALEEPKTAAQWGLAFNTYKKIAYRVVIPAGTAVKAAVNLARYGHSTGYWLVDNVSVTKMPSNLDDVMDSTTYGKVRQVTMYNGVIVGLSDGINLVPNGSLSKRFMSLPVNNIYNTIGQVIYDEWSIVNNGNWSYMYNENAVASNMLFRVGPGVTFPASAGYNCVGVASSFFDVQGGKNYVAHMLYSNTRSTVPPAGWDGLFRFLVQWLGADGSDLGPPNFVDFAVITPAGDTRWWRDGFIAPAGAKRARVFLQQYTRNTNAFPVAPAGGLWSDWRVGQVGLYAASNLDTDIEHGTIYGRTANTDLYDVSGTRRVGLRVAGSGQRVGSQRNLLQVVAQNVASTGKLTANSSGQISIVAHNALYGGFSVAYSAVTNAVTGGTIGVTYVIYCYDGDYSGGTRTWYAGTNPAAVAALGDDVYIAGQINIPTSGTGTGGGGGGGTNPGDWCVAADSYMPDGSLAVDNLPGMMLPCYNSNAEAPNIRHYAIEKNDTAMQDCVRLVTRSGATIVASKTTPMTLRNDVCIPITQMLGHDALVYRRDGSFTWDPVVEVQEAGERLVCKIVVQQQCYFAGEQPDSFIATHNPINGKP